MECENLGRNSSVALRLHMLRCRECRTAHSADAILRRGIERLKSEPAPADGMASALALFAAPTARPARSRWRTSVLKLRCLPAGTLTAAAAIGAVGWMNYIEIDPNIPVPAAAMPTPNAYDMLAKAVKAIPLTEKSGAIRTASPGSYSDYSRSEIAYALFNTPKNQAGDAKVPERQYASNADRIAHHVYTLEEKEALLPRYSESLALVRRSFAFRYQAPPVRSYKTLMPYLADYRQLARVLALEADVKAGRGDISGAVNSGLDAMELGTQVARGSGTTGFQVGTACGAIGRANLWPLIGRLDASQARSAARRLESLIQREEPLELALQEDKWTTLASLQELFHERTWRRNFLADHGGAQPSPAATFFSYRILLPYSKQAILTDFSQLMDRRIANARGPFRQSALLPDGSSPSDAVELRLERDPVVALLCPALGTLRFNHVAGLETQNRLLVVSLALRAFELERRRLPHSLSELVPGYLAAVPSDPFAVGKPLGYRDTQVKLNSFDGGQSWYPTLYSVGPDGADDSGKAIEDRHSSGNDVSKWTSAEQTKVYAIKPDSRGDILAGINIR